MSESSLSPCVKQCRLDASMQRCTGCGRTVDEITNWRSMSHEQRQAVMARLGREGRSA